MRERTLYQSKSRAFEVIFMRNTLLLGLTYDKPDRELILVAGILCFRIDFSKLFKSSAKTAQYVHAKEL
jgi:hypothetical protein